MIILPVNISSSDASMPCVQCEYDISNKLRLKKISGQLKRIRRGLFLFKMMNNVVGVVARRKKHVAFVDEKSRNTCSAELKEKKM